MRVTVDDQIFVVVLVSRVSSASELSCLFIHFSWSSCSCVFTYTPGGSYRGLFRSVVVSLVARVTSVSAINSLCLLKLYIADFETCR